MLGCVKIYGSLISLINSEDHGQACRKKRKIIVSWFGGDLR
jgi:hypothetical protein